MPKTTTKKSKEKDIADVEVLKPSKYDKMIEDYICLYRSLSSNEKLRITEVWENTFRVNIWGSNPNWINDSYFIKVREGQIVECNPPIA